MFRQIVIVIMCCVLVSSLTVFSEESIFSEYRVKAAFLFNFAKFVDWPEDAFSAPDAPIIFGILGDDPFGEALDIIKGKTINGRKVVTNRFKDANEIKTCHVLFIGSSEKKNAPSILRTLKPLRILLVGDMENFARQGGVINFIIVNNKVGFEINVDAAKRSGLKISSKLLSLAKIIHETQ